MFHTQLCDLLGIRYPILQGADGNELNRLRRVFREAQSQRREEFTAVAGQISGLIHDIRPVYEIFDTMLSEAAALAQKLMNLSEEEQ